MKIPFAAVSACVILGPLACAFAAAGSDEHAEENAAVHRWIAAAKRQAQTEAKDQAPPQPGITGTPQADGGPAIAEETPGDPFGLAPDRSPGRRHASRRPSLPGNGAEDADDEAEKDSAASSAKTAPPSSIRVLGTLVQEDSACAVVQVGGAVYRVHVGDELPAQLGRIQRIEPDLLEISAGGRVRLLTLDASQANAAPASANDAGQPASRPGRRRLTGAGVRG